jgi:uncharacterized integral membrane protein
MKGKTLIILFLVLIVAILSLQNTHTIEVNILFWSASYPLIIIIYIILGTGFAAGFGIKRLSKTHKKNKIDDDY